MPAHVDATIPPMPSVSIPTLRASTVITGSSIFRPAAGAAGAVESIDHIEPIARSPRLWDDGDVVLIDDLVAGVQSCQSAADRAGERLRRERSAAAAGVSGQKQPAEGTRGVRARSPVPITERKPWGANVATPRRSNSATRSSSAEPTTAAKPATPRPAATSAVAATGAAAKAMPAEGPVPSIRKPAVPRFSHAPQAAPSGTSSTSATTTPRQNAGSATRVRAQQQQQQRHTSTAANGAAAAMRTPPLHSGSPSARRTTSNSSPSATTSATPTVDDERIARLESAITAMLQENSRLQGRVDQLESQLARNAEVHNEVQRVLTDKVLLLSSQVHFCLSWIQQCDAAVADDDADDGATPVPADEAVAVRLDFSSEGLAAAGGSRPASSSAGGAGAAARLPPSMPIDLHQQ